MLVLTRKIMESIIVGDNIEVTVVDIGSGQVRIGINAPNDVRIYRKEVYDEIKAAAEASARSADIMASKKDQLKQIAWKVTDQKLSGLSVKEEKKKDDVDKK